MIDEYGNNINELEPNRLKVYESETLEQADGCEDFIFGGSLASGCTDERSTRKYRTVYLPIGSFMISTIGYVLQSIIKFM